MLRRCTASLALLTATLATIGPASGASIVTENGTKYAYYELMNNRATPVNDLVVIGTAPPDSVVPLNDSTGPLTIVQGATGLNTQGPLPVFLSQPGATPQGLAIDFSDYGKNDNTLAPGGVLNFKVSLDPNYSSSMAPILTLQPPDVDLSPAGGALLLSYTPSAPNAAPGAPVVAPTVVVDVTNTPEPVSLALWSALAGVGLIRARAFRRARSQSPTSA